MRRVETCEALFQPPIVCVERPGTRGIITKSGIASATHETFDSVYAARKLMPAEKRRCRRICIAL